MLAYVASHVLSTFTFRCQGLVPGNDVLSIVAYAEYLLNEKHLDNATRELTSVEGEREGSGQDWLEAARRRLGVQQALEVRHLFISDDLKMPTTEFSVGCAYLASFTCRAGTYSIMSYIFPKKHTWYKKRRPGYCMNLNRRWRCLCHGTRIARHLQHTSTYHLNHPNDRLSGTTQRDPGSWRRA